MPNPWDVGSTRLLTSLGFDALATTSAGLAWTLGRNDQHVTRDELVAHVAELAAATPLPLSSTASAALPTTSRASPDRHAARRGRRQRLLDRGLRPGHRLIDDADRAAERVPRRPTRRTGSTIRWC